MDEGEGSESCGGLLSGANDTLFLLALCLVGEWWGECEG